MPVPLFPAPQLQAINAYQHSIVGGTTIGNAQSDVLLQTCKWKSAGRKQGSKDCMPRKPKNVLGDYVERIDVSTSQAIIGIGSNVLYATMTYVKEEKMDRLVNIREPRILINKDKEICVQLTFYEANLIAIFPRWRWLIVVSLFACLSITGMCKILREVRQSLLL